MAHENSLKITTMFKGKEMRTCHNDKELEKAVAEGFEPYNPAKAEYPRMLYRGTESLRVESKEEESGYAAQGWERTPSAAYGKAAVPAGTSTPASVEVPNVAHALAIADLDSRVTALAARVAELESNGKKKKAQD